MCGSGASCDPATTIVLAVEIERLSARGGWGKGRATVEGKECCRARLLFAFAPA